MATATMACSLCYGVSENLIDLTTDEANRLNVAPILFKYFSFCFNEEPKDGCICQKCWCKIDVFHQFYVRIEIIQANIVPMRCETVEPVNDDANLIPASKVLNTTETSPLITEDSNFHENNVSDYENASVDQDYFEDSGNDDEDVKPIELVSIDVNNDGIWKEAPKINVKSKGKKNCDSVSCEHCGDGFISVYRLRKHQKEKHPEFAFKCRHYHCLEAFPTAEMLEKHKEIHVKLPCPQCGKMIQSKGLAKHIRYIHDRPTDQRVVCDLCGRVSSSIFMHKYHVRSEHEVHGRLQCDICKEWYKNKENLRSHMKSIHVEGPVTCNICGRISTNMKALAKHRKIHLEGSKERFKCIVCSKGFRDRTKLKEHSYIHTGVTDAYVCQFCGKAFRFGSSMYAHRKKEHPDEMIAAKQK